MVMRRGFGLVEVIVAMTLIGIGVLSIGAGATFATRIMRLAETEEAAARVAATVLDSLSVLPGWTADSVTAGHLRARWDSGVAGGDARVSVTVPAEPHLAFSYITTVPPLLHAIPVAATDTLP